MTINENVKFYLPKNYLGQYLYFNTLNVGLIISIILHSNLNFIFQINPFTTSIQSLPKVKKICPTYCYTGNL
jgi:hypothetical protein